MQRKQFMLGAAIAMIAVAAYLIFDYFNPKKPVVPVYSPVAETDSIGHLATLARGLTYSDATIKKLPPAASCDDNGKPLLSWRVAVLPYIEQYQLFAEFNQDEPWDSEHNKPLIEKMPDAFKSPLAGDLGGKTVYLAATGPGTMFVGQEGQKLGADANTETIMIVEVEPAQAVPWTKPDDLVVDKGNPTKGLARDKAGNFEFGFTNGRSGPLAANIPPEELWSHFMRATGEAPTK